MSTNAQVMWSLWKEWSWFKQMLELTSMQIAIWKIIAWRYVGNWRMIWILDEEESNDVGMEPFQVNLDWIDHNAWKLVTTLLIEIFECYGMIASCIFLWQIHFCWYCIVWWYFLFCDYMVMMMILFEDALLAKIIIFLA